MTTRSKDNEKHFERMLTGLAIHEAYHRRDIRQVESIAAHTSPHETVLGLLMAMEVTHGVFARSLGLTPQQVTDGIRNRIVAAMAEAEEA